MSSSSNVEQQDWMQGFPPARDKVIRFADGSFYQWPKFKWAVCNIQQLVTTKCIWRGAGSARQLEESLLGFDELTITSTQGEQKTWQQALQHTQTDGLLVMKSGRIVHETYRDHLTADKPHLIMSAAKSMVGMLAQMMYASGELDAQQQVIHYLPELAHTAWGDATVRQLFDMEIDMVFEEDYLDPDSEVWRYLRCGGMLPQGDDDWECLTDYVVGVKKQGQHGLAFAYREPNVNVASWLLRRITNKHLNDLLSERIWQHLGVAHDGVYMLDPSGAETTMALTMRSLMLFGEWVRTHGYGALDESVASTLFAGNCPQKFAKAGYNSMPGWSYKSMWWVRHMEHGNAICARGAHGQILYIDPAKELVVAWCSSTQKAPGILHDDWRMPMFDAITQFTN